MTKIHPTAVIEPGANIGKDVVVGPYSIIKGTVTLEDGVEIKGQVYLDGNTTIGAESVIWPFASIGTKTQDLKYRGEETFVTIGRGCQIREYVTVNSSTVPGSTVKVGDYCLLMTGCHVAHDCEVGNHVIMANNASIAGHVIIEDYANVGGFVGVHQRCRIGTHAMVGGMSKIVRDVPPYALAAGNPTRVGGLNIVGLKRKNFSLELRRQLSQAFRFIFQSGLSLDAAVDRIEKELPIGDELSKLLVFCRGTQRGLLPRGKNVQFQELEKDPVEWE